MNLINAAGSNDKKVFIEALLSALSDFYTKDSTDTNLYKLYSALASILALSDREISALLNDNYLSVSVTDEVVERTIETLDRLRQEGAFKVDRVGFTPTYSTRKETHYIENKDTTVYLQYIPLDYTQVSMYNSKDPSKIQVTFIIDYSADDNTITVAGVSKPGLYTFEYADTGNVKSETEVIQVPTELFEIGFGEGGFGDFGFGV